TRGDLPGGRRFRQEALAGREPLSTQDHFWDLALGVGLARRGDQLHELAREWNQGAHRLMSHAANLFDILALAEIHVAGVRVRDTATVVREVQAVRQVLSRLDDPPLWSTPL